MSAAAAARMGDEVAHGFGLLAMVGGALLGAAVGAAIIGTALTGGAALAVVAGCVAGGGLSMGQLVKGVTKIFDLPEPTSGVLQSGSGNVRINSRLAVRAEMDIANCSGFPINHFPLPAVPVAEGSATVRINGKPAARIGSKLMCGAHIKSGSKNVTIGGPAVRVLAVYDTEEWAEKSLKALGIFALGVGGRAIYLAGGKAALGKFAGATLAGMLGFEGLGQLGDAMGPGYRDVLQGVAGLVLLGLGGRAAKGTKPIAKEKPFNLVELRKKAGVKEENLQVEAVFIKDGKIYYDVNQTARNPLKATSDKTPIYNQKSVDAGKPNNTMADAHAEIGAMTQAHADGKRGGSAELFLTGKDACSYCVSDVKKMAIELQLQELTVFQPSGTVKFSTPKDFNPVKKGGIKW